MESHSAAARLGPVDALDLRPVFQPIVDLRDGAVIGYEALLPEGGKLHDAALRDAAAHGLAAPFSLFLNADPGMLDGTAPELPATGLTLLVGVTEQALTARPEAMLRALTRLRSAGCGIALDNVGGDSRSLALMSIFYPDVIKIDLRLLAERKSEELARIVTAVGAEAERRHATVLAEGIDSDDLRATAHACGATLGQGEQLGPPAPLPAPLPPPGRALRLPGAGGDPFGPTPWERVTNWRRPSTGSRELATQAARMLVDRAADIGESAMVLIALADDQHGRGSVERYGWLPERVAFVGVLNAGRAYEGTGVRSGLLAPDDPLLGTGTLVALAPDFAACFVVRQTGTEQWAFAVTYDRDTVLECALPLMARMDPLAG